MRAVKSRRSKVDLEEEIRATPGQLADDSEKLFNTAIQKLPGNA